MKMNDSPLVLLREDCKIYHLVSAKLWLCFFAVVMNIYPASYKLFYPDCVLLASRRETLSVEEGG